jgi:peptidoglycan hydrolase-like protein with peptidoglycan-binding domain
MAAAVLAAATATGGVVVLSDAEQAAPAAREPAASTAAVERGALSAMVALNGTLTHRARADGAPYAVFNQARGTYTKLPAAGDEVGCGDVLYRVDDVPVLLLCGAVPAYRDLALGATGDDVRQLNRNLRALGYDAGEPGDRDFTWQTREALKRLQHRKGFDATGALARDAAVVLPEPVRIAKVTGALGAPARPGGPVARATSEALEVRVDLEATQQGEVRQGDRARITLPGNRSVTGRVARLGSVAQIPAGQDANVGDATIPASIRLDDPKQARGLDEAPVQVQITTKGVQNALSVPVTALVGTSGGGFAVEVARAGGRRALVAVKLGLFDTGGGRVQVAGDVRAGDRVVVPSS